jgi:aspartate/methionine/tyrosine aminotransferase
MSERFNALEGMSCVPADGAMYLLPKIDMPQKAIEEAEKRGKKADVMYTLDLLGKSSPLGRLFTRHPLGCLVEGLEGER